MSAGPFALNFRHLRALSAIHARGSMSAAAEAVNLSQPALTQGLAKLERQLGMPLFTRHPDGVRATEAGLALTARADLAFAHLAAGARQTARTGRRGFARPEQLMTATQLHAFLALVDAGSFVAAARKVGQSQPALHRAVRDLEQICGVALAVRQGRGITVSPAGHRLARGIRLAAGEIAAGLAELPGDLGRPSRIVVGAMPLCRALVLPHAIAASTREGARLGIDIREGSWRELVDPLRDGAIDLMIGALRGEPPPDCEQRPLFDDRLAVIGRAGHPLAASRAPALDALAKCSWIVGQEGTPLRDHWNRLFAGRERPAAAIECGSVMVIRGILAVTDYLTLLSPDQVALEIDRGLLSLIGPPLANGTRTIGVTTRIGWHPTPAQRRFMELLAIAAVATRLPENK